MVLPCDGCKGGLERAYDRQAEEASTLGEDGDSGTLEAAQGGTPSTTTATNTSQPGPRHHLAPGRTYIIEQAGACAEYGSDLWSS